MQETDRFTPRSEINTASEEAVLLAQLATMPSEEQYDHVTHTTSENSSMRIEQVELTHRQLSLKAVSRAEKALDANDMQTALSAYAEALRYEPMNADTRQKLSALYFGKGDTRKAYEIIQEGINLDTNNQVLRLALSKLLVKANQPEAALSRLFICLQYQVEITWRCVRHWHKNTSKMTLRLRAINSSLSVNRKTRAGG